MKIELTQTQAELLDQMVQEEIMRVESVRDLQYRSQILASLRSLKNKLEKTAPAAIDRFDIYVYSSDSVGGPVRIVPDQTEYKARAQLFAQAGFNVKVVDQFDGAVVYTLDAMPQ